MVSAQNASVYNVNILLLAYQEEHLAQHWH